MIKHFDLKLNSRPGEKMEVSHIAVGDIQSSITILLDQNTAFSREIVPAGFGDSIYFGGKN
ncbi:MAG: hypothetical protein WC979_07450 [Candidatus Pacearchaeota archaeon]|jgi:hypothetical protein